jgi:hypothetical protein
MPLAQHLRDLDEVTATQKELAAKELELGDKSGEEGQAIKRSHVLTQRIRLPMNRPVITVMVL